MTRAGGFAQRVVLCAGLLAGACFAPAQADAVRAPQGQGDAARQAAFDAAFDDAGKRYDLPGLAVGIVVDGRVVYRRTHGELEVGSGRAIDADTVFKIASNSKAMTAGLLARLVDQGKLRWDDPVTRWLPDFRMHDPWVTREIQVRDLLIHNSGLGPGAGDLMLWPEPNLFTREDVIAGMAHLKPIYSFRSRYAYDNSLYIVAGEVAAAAGGAPFDVLVRREVFEPLGLDRCQVGAWQRDVVGNVAQPHRVADGRNVVVRADDEMIPDVPMMAAGGIRCSLDDMLAWARMWLDPEHVGLDAQGRPWLSEAQRKAVWDNHTLMPLSAQMREWDSSHYSAYGYGWRLTDVDGTWKVSHTGTLAGMLSHLVLLPDKNVGIVYLANGGSGEARTVLPQVLLKQFTREDAAGLDVAHYAGLMEAQRQSRAESADAPAVVPPGARTPFPLRDATVVQGVYRDPWFGQASVCPQAGRIEFASAKSPKLTGTLMRVQGRPLVQWHADDVSAEAWLDFVPASGIEPARMTVAKVDPTVDFSYNYEDLAFVRIGDCPGR